MARLLRKRPTLYDVAQRAGVSYQTVSRVINQSPNVSAVTRRRVLDAIQVLGYQPNYAAQSLVTRRTLAFEVITYGVSFYGPAQTLVGIEQAARAAGYRLFFSNSEKISDDDIPAFVDSLGGHRVDGAIVIAPVEAALYTSLERAFEGIPLVRVGSARDAREASVVIDQHYSSQLATQHLIDLGHRHVAAIRGPLGWHDAAARHEGWLAALRANGLTPVAYETGNWSAESGYSAAQILLRSNQTFTGLVVANDQMALGAVSAIRESGLRVPHDISVIGFDDLPEAMYFTPPLTTIRQDFTAMGAQSVEYLIQLIRNPETPVHQRVIYPQFILRQSTAAPPH